MKTIKRSLSLGFLFCFVLAFTCAQTVFNTEKAIVDTGSKEFKGISAAQTVKDMKTGWDLGNDMDCYAKGLGAETAWGMPAATKAMIDTLAASGIKTLRIPTTWSTHIIDKNYTIDPKWMARVKQIVDWAMENDMYVVLNTHHDCYEKPTAIPHGRVYGYYPNKVNYDESVQYLTNIWTQIALAFNNGYDEHLIFETMNEPRLRGTNNEWWNKVGSDQYNEATDCLNKYNQICVDTIRSTGGNNQKRYIMVPGLRAAVDSIIENHFKFPNDDEPGKIIGSIHMYDPQDFAMNGSGSKEFLQRHKDALQSTWGYLDTWVLSKGYPVVIGEYGATNKGNTEARVEWFKYFLGETQKKGMTCILWDNGGFDASTSQGEKFGYFNRNTLKWEFPEIIDAINETIYENKN